MGKSFYLRTDFVQSIPLAESAVKPVFYYDSKLPGFGLKATLKDKTYFAEAKVNRKTCRKKIDSYLILSTEEARKRAKVLLGEMHQGINPTQRARFDLEKGKSFEEVCKEYLSQRELADRTRRDYLYHMGRTFSKWLSRPIISITREEAEKLFYASAVVSPAQANQAFRFARAVFRFAKKYRNSSNGQLLKENPIEVISENRLWKRIPKRTNSIKAHEFQPLWESLWTLQNKGRCQDRETDRDFLLLLLFTGLRHREGLTLRWDNVDFRAQTITIPETKNHEIHVLPLSDYLYRLLDQRKKKVGNSTWVFPSARSHGEKHLVDIRPTLHIVNKESAVFFTPHDLRRTFLSIARQLPGRYNIFLIKRLANHKVSDITSDYIQIDEREFRKCMQEITDYILDVTRAKKSGIGMPEPKAPPIPQARRIRIRKSEPAVAQVQI